MRPSAPSLILAFVMLASGAVAPAEETKGAKPYSVGGERHGTSYFPLVAYAAAKPIVAGELDFAHYPDNAEVLKILRKWEKEYPNLVTLYSVGKSFEGRDIWQMTITNRATGPDTDKPCSSKPTGIPAR
jgi:Zinc carboxypeptidase